VEGVVLYQVTKANNRFNVGDTVEVVKKIGKRIWTVKRLNGAGRTGNILTDNLFVFAPAVQYPVVQRSRTTTTTSTGSWSATFPPCNAITSTFRH
jgi:hypothetical protein